MVMYHLQEPLGNISNIKFNVNLHFGLIILLYEYLSYMVVGSKHQIRQAEQFVSNYFLPPEPTLVCWDLIYYITIFVSEPKIT